MWVIVGLSLAATVTNRVPLSLIGFGWLLGIGVVGWISQPTPPPKLTLFCLAYLGLSLISTWIYSPQALSNPGFYRYDGNLLITYEPLLVLPWLPTLPKSSGKILRNFVRWSCSVSLIALVLLKLAGNAEWQKGLFNSTNGFGGFLMIVACLAVGWFAADRNTKVEPGFWVIVSTGMIIAAKSRGSLLGVGLSILLLPLLQAWGARSFKAGILLIAALITSIQLVLIAPAVQTYSGGAHEAALADAFHESDGTKDANILIRVYENWPRGIYLFLKSPLLGTGYGSANDFPFSFEHNGPSLLQLNQTREYTFSDAHAHHTYFHILGEQGLIGLLVFLLFWGEILNTLIRSKGEHSVRLGLCLAWVALTFASFTEHRIPSPSNAFPFVLMICLYWIAQPKQRLKSIGHPSVGQDGAASQLPTHTPKAHGSWDRRRSSQTSPQRDSSSVPRRRPW